MACAPFFDGIALAVWNSLIETLDLDPENTANVSNGF
jgi:hypothetical protein